MPDNETVESLLLEIVWAGGRCRLCSAFRGEEHRLNCPARRALDLAAQERQAHEEMKRLLDNADKDFECIHCHEVDGDNDHWQRCAKHPARAQVETLARALDSVDSDLADTIEFRHEGKQMATSFFEESRERIREALSSLPKGAMKGDGA